MLGIGHTVTSSSLGTRDGFCQFSSDRHRTQQRNNDGPLLENALMANQLRHKAARTRPSSNDDPLNTFLPWIADWFRRELGAPTAPQVDAWPLIQEKRHVLIHSPTGTGKTFAAFLWALNQLLSETAPRERGVRVLYVSPLKALNYDVEQNLTGPLAALRAEAHDQGIETGEVRVAVRTGDTPSSARAAMVRRPPQILITTPESLYLILTSAKSRDILRTVETVIVDEIHTVCANKRGVHLALSLERLEELAPEFQRIGLSATQNPIEEVAAFLGGHALAPTANNPDRMRPRPVEIVDVDYKKEVHVQVLGFPDLIPGEESAGLWPSIIPKVLRDILQHRSTLVFANSRRQAEQAADRLNAELSADEVAELGRQPAADALAYRGSIFATGAGEGPFKAHHGSLAQDQRRALERDLKAGRLPALVGTSTLELGIDIGDVDLMVQLGSPKSVTQALQRIGRAGHRVGEVSEGRIYSLHDEDLFEAALIAHGVQRREVEALHLPRHALDVLAQQLVAAVSVEDWPVERLFELVRRAHPYRDLPQSAFESVLKMLAGQFHNRWFRSLRPRLYWDKVHGALSALPGARMQALSNPGAIVDTGQFGVYLPDGKTRIGELDEEFVFETKPGDVFVLGSQVWRALEIDADRVVVAPAPGAMPRMPFWNGEGLWRPFPTGVALGRFRGELATRLGPSLDSDEDPPAVVRWLERDYAVDTLGAHRLIAYVRRQLRSAGAISSDRHVVVETYRDAVGDWRMVLQSPFGGRVHAPWALALAAEIESEVGVEPEMQVGDDGIMFRIPGSDGEPPVDLVSRLTADTAQQRVAERISHSAVFGAVFRQNAYRALLLSGGFGGGPRSRSARTPFWLQRMRAKDLLAAVRRFRDFPIILETYRECLEDRMDVPALREVLSRIQTGEIEVVPVRTATPSPVARSLDFAFSSIYLYRWDEPKAERELRALQLDSHTLAELFQDGALSQILRPDAIREVANRVGRTAPGWKARSPVELAQLLEELGDLSFDEIAARCEGDATEWIRTLEHEGRAAQVTFREAAGTEALRWVPASTVSAYQAMAAGNTSADVLDSVVQTVALRRGPVTARSLAERYGCAEGVAEESLDRLTEAGTLVRGHFTSDDETQWADPEAISQMRSATMSILRREVQPVSPLRYAAAVREIQRVAIPEGRGGRDAPVEELASALTQLRGRPLLLDDLATWTLPLRVPGFRETHLDELLRSGSVVCVADPSSTPADPRLIFFPRATGSVFGISTVPPEVDAIGQTEPSRVVHAFLESEGVATSSDLRSAMTSMPLVELRATLRDLVLGGLVTSDSWIAMNGILRRDPSASTRADTGTRSLRESRRAAARRIREAGQTLPSNARWMTTRRFAIRGPNQDAAHAAAARAEALLDRYGVVTRAALQWEESGWEWGPIEAALGNMELRGQARRGYFVQGLPGVQFARPDVVERLRSPVDPRIITLVPARDPSLVLDRDLTLHEETVDPDLTHFSRNASTFLGFAAEALALLAEEQSERLTVAMNAPETAIVALLRILRDSRVRTGKRVVVARWNGAPAAGSAGEPILASLGFRQDFRSMVFDSIQARIAGVS